MTTLTDNSAPGRPVARRGRGRRPRRRRRSASRLLGRDYVVLARRRAAMSSPRPTGARTARRRCRSATWRAAAWSARTTAGRSATAAAASPCRRPPPGVPVPPKAHLAAIAASTSATAWCGCARATPAAKIPAMRPRTTTRPTGASTRASSVWRTSAPRMTDNFLDISHFPYVHIGTFGIAANTQVPKFEIVAARRRTSPATRTRSRSANDLGKSASGLDGRGDQAAR